MGLKPTMMCWDSGASSSISGNASLFGALHDCDPVSFSGISAKASVLARQRGDLQSFPDVYYSPTAALTLLSGTQYETLPGCKIKYNQKRRQYTVQINGWIYKFSHHKPSGLKICDLARDGDVVPVNSFPTNMTVEEPINVKCYVTTVEDMKRQFTRREIKSAEVARQWMARMGSFTLETAIKQTSTIKNCPVTADDCRRAVIIYGPSLQRTRGATVSHNPKRIVPESILVPYLERKVHLGIDLMYVEGEAFLLSVSADLDMSIVSHIGTVGSPGVRSGSNILKHLRAHLSKYGSHNFQVVSIHTDGEGGIQTIVPYLQELHVEVDQTAAGDHVAHVERKIRTIKDRIRGEYTSNLPFKVCKALLIALVYWSTAVVNAMPSIGGSHSAPPIETFTGRKIDNKRDFKVKWGDYCEPVEPSSPLVKSKVNVGRTRACIAAYPTGNSNGSWVFYCIDTRKFITRTQYGEAIPMPQHVIDRLDTIYRHELHNRSRFSSYSHGKHGDMIRDSQDEGAIDFLKDTPKMSVPSHAPTSFDDGDVQLADNLPPPDDNVISQVIPASAVPSEPVATSPVSRVDDDGPELEAPVVSSGSEDDKSLDGEAEAQTDNDHQQPLTQEEENVQPIVPPKAFPVDYDSMPKGRTRSGRSYNPFANVVYLSAADMCLPEFSKAVSDGHIVMVSTSEESNDPLSSGAHEYCLQLSASKALKTMPEAAAKSIFAEVSQLDDKCVIKPVLASDLDDQAKKAIIRSSLFLKEKYLPDGTFDKLKARLVAGGHLQDRSLYMDEEITSPTAALSSVFMMCAIAAKEGRISITADVPGAYLNAKMPEGKGGKKIHMSLNKIEAAFLVKKRPEYSKFLRRDGTMVVRLEKALYGLLESARLWYEDMKSTLESLGFISNTQDICIFNKMVGDQQISVALYVDDLLITSCSDVAINELLKALTEKYDGLTVRQGPILSYLGMTWDFNDPGQVSVTMSGYVEDLLKQYPTSGTVLTPAAAQLFDTSDTAKKLTSDESKVFHSKVMKLFYLAKRVRPDILLPIQFLSTRVAAPDEQDSRKVDRVLKYLNGTKELGLKLQIDTDIENSLTGYIDASYGVHRDAKSHTGTVIALGKGAVYVKSGKQKIVSKSSHEAELVALSDGAGQVLWSREFLIAQGYNMQPATIKQDNKSTIQTAEKGRPCSERSRHINIRHFWVKEKIDNEELALEYLPTEEMIADIMTKPLQGEAFIAQRDRMLNWSM